MTDYRTIKLSDIEALTRYEPGTCSEWCGMYEEKDGSYIDIDDLRALLDKAPSFEPVEVVPDFFQLDNGSDYWYECPHDEAILSDLDDITFGTEYTVFASHTYRQTYRVVKIPDENDDDTLVELVSSQRKYYTSPPQAEARIAELEKALHEINSLRSSTLNYAMARVIACKALGIEHTQSSEPPSCIYTDATAREASARAIADHNQIMQQNAKLTEMQAELDEAKRILKKAAMYPSENMISDWANEFLEKDK